MSHNKYTDLELLHKQLRTEQHDKLKSASQEAVTNNATRENVADAPIVQSVAHRTPDIGSGKKSSKSFAQVAISVGQNVLQKSCERRSKKAKQKEPIKYPAPLRVRYPTYEERERVLEAARQAGYKSVSAYLRDVSVEPYKILVPPSDPEQTKALLALNKELTSQGNNLNQLAKQMNGGKASVTEAEGVLGVLARSMLGTHRAIRQALSRGKEPEP